MPEGESFEGYGVPAKHATVLVNVNQRDRDIVHNYADNVFFTVTRVLYPDHVDW